MSKKIKMLLVAVIGVIGLAACTDLGNEVSGYYVSVDINPSIEFVVDGNDVVESYLFLNEDAEILCSDLDFVGMNVDEAVALFLQTATDAGYVDPEGNDNAVLITVLCEENEEAREESIRERVQDAALRHFRRQGITALVITEDYTQEDLLLEAEELGVTPAKLKLAKAAMLGDETLVLEELLEMPVKDILSLVREYHQDYIQDYTAERKTQLQERKQELIAEHKAVIDEFRANNPELTDEEVDAWITEYKETVKEETIQQWRDRVQNWKDNRNSNQEDNE